MIEKQFNIAIDADLQTTSDGANPGGPPSTKTFTCSESEPI
jgi:hypothetical protein